MLIDIFGYVGSFLLNLSFLPQTIQVCKTQKTRDISIYFLFFNILTNIVLSTYAYLIDSIHLIIANIGLFIQVIIILYYKLKNRKDEEIEKQIELEQNHIHEPEEQEEQEEPEEPEELYYINTTSI